MTPFASATEIHIRCQSRPPPVPTVSALGTDLERERRRRRARVADRHRAGRCAARAGRLAPPRIDDALLGVRKGHGAAGVHELEGAPVGGPAEDHDAPSTTAATSALTRCEARIRSPCPWSRSRAPRCSDAALPARSVAAVDGAQSIVEAPVGGPGRAGDNGAERDHDLVAVEHRSVPASRAPPVVRSASSRRSVPVSATFVLLAASQIESVSSGAGVGHAHVDRGRGAGPARQQRGRRERLRVGEGEHVAGVDAPGGAAAVDGLDAGRGRSRVVDARVHARRGRAAAERVERGRAQLVGAVGVRPGVPRARVRGAGVRADRGPARAEDLRWIVTEATPAGSVAVAVSVAEPRIGAPGSLRTTVGPTVVDPAVGHRRRRARVAGDVGGDRAQVVERRRSTAAVFHAQVKGAALSVQISVQVDEPAVARSIRTEAMPEPASAADGAELHGALQRRAGVGQRGRGRRGVVDPPGEDRGGRREAGAVGGDGARVVEAVVGDRRVRRAGEGRRGRRADVDPDAGRGRPDLEADASRRRSRRRRRRSRSSSSCRARPASARSPTRSARVLSTRRELTTEVAVFPARSVTSERRS